MYRMLMPLERGNRRIGKESREVKGLLEKISFLLLSLSENYDENRKECRKHNKLLVQSPAGRTPVALTRLLLLQSITRPASNPTGKSQTA